MRIAYVHFEPDGTLCEFCVKNLNSGCTGMFDKKLRGDAEPMLYFEECNPE